MGKPQTSEARGDFKPLKQMSPFESIKGSMKRKYRKPDGKIVI